MTYGRYKSRTFRRVFKRTPGGRTVMRYARRKVNKPQCGDCKAELKGVPRLRVTQIRGLSKTKKRPQRRYGGTLCSKCSRKRIIASVRK